MERLEQLGEDPNYIHPSHNNSPMLYTTQFDYTDSLSVLLASARLDARSSLTKDRKVETLVQSGVHQYCEFKAAQASFLYQKKKNTL